MVSVLVSYFRTPRVQIAALIYFLIAGILTRIPLFNYLGYEFSALMSIPAAIISGLLTIKFMREHRAKPLTRRTWMFVLLDYLLVNTLLLLIPLAVISLNALAVKNCAFGRGLVYYLLLTEGAMIFSVALALVIGVLFRHGIMIFLAAVTGLLLHILYVTITQPQLFAYNFILGFFPGITYDESLSDINQIILYREFTLIASLMMVTLFIVLVRAFRSSDPIRTNVKMVKKHFHTEKTLWALIVICASIVVIGHIFRGDLGFEYSEEEIADALGRRSESDHFVILYDGQDHSAAEIQILKAECEFHYRIVREFLGQLPHSPKKISVYLYPTAETKQRYIGTSNTNIAKPWKQEIHLTTGTFRSTFRHELVHILAAEFGVPLLGASTRMGLNEGLAVAVDWDEGLFSPHEYAAALLRDSALEETEQLFTLTGFAVRSNTYAYIVAGSFSRYLIERFGMERYRHVFPNGNFVAAFGESLSSLLKDWKASLRSIDVSSIPSVTVKALFSQPSIFYKTCAREVASRLQHGGTAYRDRDFSRAEQEYAAAFANAPSAGALRGLMQSLMAQQRPAEALRLFKDLPQHSPLRENPSLIMAKADAHFMNGEFDPASAQYRTVSQMKFSESFIESSELKQQLIIDRTTPQEFHELFYSGRSDSSRIRLIDSLIQLNRNAVSLQFIRSVLHRTDEIDTETFLRYDTAHETQLPYFLLIRGAERSYRKGKYEEAKQRLWSAKNRVPTAALTVRIDEQIDLYDFVMSEVQ